MRIGIRVASITTDTLSHQMTAVDILSDNCLCKFIINWVIPHGASCVTHVLNLCYGADIINWKKGHFKFIKNTNKVFSKLVIFINLFKFFNNLIKNKINFFLKKYFY